MNWWNHIIDTVKDINIPSVYIGIVALVILVISKKVMPKFPMAVVLMVAGVMMTKFMPLQQWGVKTLDSVAPGLPSWKIPNFGAYPMTDLFMISLSVAVVIMAETLLAENSFAQKNGYRINDNQEILAFSLGNLVAGIYRLLSYKWIGFKNCNGRAVSGKNTINRNYSRLIHDASSFWWYRLYWIFTGTNSYGNSNFSINWCNRV